MFDSIPYRIDKKVCYINFIPLFKTRKKYTNNQLSLSFGIILKVKYFAGGAMAEKLFGTDGVRGKANVFLTSDLAFQLGQALSVEFKALNEGNSCKGKEGQKPFIIIGRDSRISGKMLECALTAGICSVGIDVWLLDVIPTPVIAWMTKYTCALAGAVISASHNPAEDNGIKFFNSSGYKLSDELEERIENNIHTGLKKVSHATGPDIGRVYNKINIIKRYRDFIKKSLNADLSNFNILMDTANGATYKIAPQVFESLGADVSVIHAHPDGININHKCGSTHLEDIKKKMKTGKYDIGLAFDGDGDRVLVVTPNGKELNGDQLMYICSKYLDSLKSNDTVVATVMSNLSLEQKINGMGKKFIRTKVGDRYVLEEMINTGAKLGGEQSGHIIFTDHNTTGDGIITAIQLLTAIRASKKGIDKLLEEIELYPQILRNVRCTNIKGWDSNKNISAAIAKAEKELTGKGRVLIRPSGTEPLIRIMLEGNDEKQINQLTDMLEVVIKKEVS